MCIILLINLMAFFVFYLINHTFVDSSQQGGLINSAIPGLSNNKRP
jgi:hypothetical protein